MRTPSSWAWIVFFVILNACSDAPGGSNDTGEDVDTRIDEVLEDTRTDSVEPPDTREVVDSDTPDTSGDSAGDTGLPDSVDSADSVDPDTGTPDTVTPDTSTDTTTSDTSPDTDDTADTTDTTDTDDPSETGDGDASGETTEDTTPELCREGACDDGDPCTADRCDPETGVCSYSDDDGARCDDGDDCTVEDTCFEGECEPGPPRDCSDDNACTVDGCRLGPVGEAVCFHRARSCDDGESCTSDSCSPATGCVFSPRAGPCQDGDACTVSDQCQGGVCVAGVAANCDDGVACTNDRCDPALGCVYEATAGCSCGDGVLQGGEQCDDGNTITGDGCSAGCRVERCGDGVVHVTLGEQCDDGNRRNGDGCDGTCVRERCGDGIVQEGLGEDCDDGNTVAADGCGPGCAFEGCGDGVLQAALGEQCDDGNPELGDGCTPGCRLERCGDGVVQAPREQCDDGNTRSQDGCSSACVVESCGDGIVQPGRGEQCDDGNTTFDDGCGSSCRVEFCGDGVEQPSAEECDDGNVALDDGCGPSCRIERCGDGFLQDGETCDDGGELSGDGCSASCGYEPCSRLTFVLDANYGGIAAGWQVRDRSGRIVFEVPTNTPINQRFTTFIAQITAGDYLLHKRSHNNNGWLGSTLRITRPDGVEIWVGGHPAGPEVVVPLRVDCVSFCGDGLVDAERGETCDDANGDDEDTCRNTCVLKGCGDGTLDPSEACDDGNTAPQDACSAACTFEPCASRSLRVTNLTGDWVYSDWRIKDRSGATVARGWDEVGGTPLIAPNGSLETVVQLRSGVYTFEPLTNTQVATWTDKRFALSDPDGVVRALGQSSSVFSLQCPAFCGDQVVQPELGEGCDDGNRTRDDGCGNTCRVEGCGDGIVQTTRGEACDDGNTADGDTCRGDCSLTNCAPWRLEVEVPQTDPTLVASTAWAIRTAEGYLVASGSPGVEGPGGIQRTSLRLPPGPLTLEASSASLSVGPIVTMYRPDGSRAFGFTTLGATSRTVPFVATCVPATCGDNVRGDGEACDDGGILADDGCGPTCALEACGDGQLRAGESCDDGNTSAGDGCSSGCGFEPCTRHVVRVKRTGQLAFFPRWRVLDAGQRVVASGEARIFADGGTLDVNVSLLPGSYTFETRALHGNLYGPGGWDAAEYTVLGPSGQVLATGLNTKPFVASCPSFCGDGITQAGEQCDDGGNAVGDGCGADCKVERCGDGLLQMGEACDDGGEVLGDGCSEACAFEPCAGHRVEVTSGLDGYMVRWRIVDGSGRVLEAVDGHPSSATSTRMVQLPAGAYTYVAVPWFGQLGYAVVRVLAPDDTVVRSFTVEPGRPFDTRFDFETRCLPFCGDGVVTDDEECDDGGRMTGDGCGAGCLIEACGDGVVQGELGEGCDDGNLVSGDGCDAACKVEGCGDGKVQPGLGETCEDGNTQANDGCANCRLEVCGDGIVQRLRGEVCDDGDTTDAGSCSGDCKRVQCAPLSVRFFFPERPEQVGFRMVDGLGVVAASLEPGALPPFPRDITRSLTLAPGAYTFTAVGANASSFNGGTFIVTDDAGVTLASGAVPAGASEASRALTLGCIAPWCGDGVVQEGEACDDGDRDDGDGCSASCEVERCGDGVVQRERGESCDDGGVVGGDGCSETCVATCRPISVEVETLYGGERVAWTLRDEAGAVVDAAPVGTYAGRGSRITPLTVTGGTYFFEVAPAVDAAGTVRVQVAPNNFGYWESLSATARPPQQVTVVCDAHWCGDGATDPDEGEACDDGNGMSGDGCTPACVAEVCGDGLLHPGLGEECDDGDTDAGDCCGPTCRIERCGDGVDQPDEGCDDGNTADGDGCDGECVLEVCGNGKAQSGEECDDGDLDFGDGCDGECVSEVCGDGLVQAGIGETCDDGNRVSGDGCDAGCVAEVCGNGRIQVAEQCDDGNLIAGDGCSAGCVGEPCARHVVRVSSPGGGGGILWSLVRDDGVVVASFATTGRARLATAARRAASTSPAPSTESSCSSGPATPATASPMGSAMSSSRRRL